MLSIGQRVRMAKYLNLKDGIKLTIEYRQELIVEINLTKSFNDNIMVVSSIRKEIIMSKYQGVSVAKALELLDYLIYQNKIQGSDLEELKKALVQEDKVIKAREVADLRSWNLNKLFDNGSL